MKWIGLPVDLGQVLREGVDPLLLPTPVELGAPVSTPARGRSWRAVVPVVAGGRLGQPGAGEAGLQVVEVRLRDRDREGADGG